MGRRRGDSECSGNLGFGVAVGKHHEGGLLSGREGLESSFEVELGDELLLLLVGQALPNLKLSGAEGVGPLLDLVQIKEAEALAQRRIPSWDPDRLGAALLAP